jgi:putative ABC transport system permease protein
VEHTVSYITVDPDFLATYRIELLAGRNFSVERPSELVSRNLQAGQLLGILLTRSSLRRFGFTSPETALGATFHYVGDTEPRTYTVIGVVEDFMFSPMESDVRSIAVLMGTAEPLRALTLRLAEGYAPDTIDAMKAVWNRHIPGVPFNVSFMEDVISAEIAGKTQSLATAASMAALVFFVTAIIGIYAQASFVCDRNAKSIAIRKVLGSTRRAILGWLLTQFSLPVFASFVLALPLATYFIETFYGSFQDSPGFPVYLYALCLAGIAALAVVTVFTHCQRAAARHPIHSLRYE